ncbi:MAG: hypothetical protein VX642_09880 [Bdellovibrionota bacterium]|nr:hypothetical protein [Bdellovibrionota bacterium]
MRFLCYFFIIAMTCSDLVAGLQLQVEESIAVYKKRNSKTRPIFYLEKGMTANLRMKSKKSKWYRVYVKKSGRTFKAWIQSKDIYWSKILDSNAQKTQVSKKAARKLLPKRAFGLLFEFNRTNMGELSFQDSGGITSQFDAMNGDSSYFGFFFEVPRENGNLIRAEFALQSFNVKGEGIYSGSSTKSDIELTQNFLSVRFAYHHFLFQNFFAVMGGAVDNGQSVTLRVDSTEEDVSGEDLPFYIRGILGIGYNFYSGDSFKVDCVAKGSYVFNSDRSIFPLAFNLSVAYRY